VQVISKNPDRVQFGDFQYSCISYLMNTKDETITLAQLNNWVKNRASHFSKTASSRVKSFIVKESSEFLALAKSIVTGKLVDIGKLLYLKFDGVLLTQSPTNDKLYDAVVMQTPERIICHVWCPTKNEIYDELQIQLQAQEDFGVSCSKIDVKYPLSNTSVKVLTKPTSKKKKLISKTLHTIKPDTVIGIIKTE